MIEITSHEQYCENMFSLKPQRLPVCHSLKFSQEVIIVQQQTKSEK